MFLFYTNPILIAAAVLPAIFLLVHVYRADKLERSEELLVGKEWRSRCSPYH